MSRSGRIRNGVSSLRPLDAGVRYIRANLGSMLPMCVLTFAPLVAAMWLAINAITAEDRAALPIACVAITFGLIWRWMGQAAIQRRVQADLEGSPRRSVRSRGLAIITIRMLAVMSMTWAGPLFFPAYYGFFVVAFIVPALLASDRPAAVELIQTLKITTSAVGLLARLSFAMLGLMALAFIGFVTLVWVMVSTVLPSLLGFDTADLALTLSSSAWTFTMLFVLIASFDIFWTVASVFVLYELESRRLGQDLQAQLIALSEVPA